MFRLKRYPRFVPANNYAASFGYQWNKFKLEQIDSERDELSAARFYSETGWTKECSRASGFGLGAAARDVFSMLPRTAKRKSRARHKQRD